MHVRLLVISFIAGLMVTACSSQGVTPGGAAPAAATFSRSSGLSASSKPYLYVGNDSSVTVYASGASKPFRKIKHYYCANELTFDPTGDLYVLCGAIDAGSINEYAAGTAQLLRSFNGEGVPSIAVDNQGFLYVAGGASVFVYPPQGQRLWHTIRRDTGAGPSSLLSGPNGDLYIGQPHGVSVFGRGTPGKPKFLREVHSNVKGPIAFALSAAGDLFVANCFSCLGYLGGGRDTVTVYSPRGSEVRKIHKGVRAPATLAVDAAGRLYVANIPVSDRGFARGWISVFARGATMPLRKITEGIDVPLGLTVDPDGKLYVANYRGDSVTVYSPGGTKLLRTITDGVKYPQSVAISNY
jgi:DNA-binding beta-propeller fold protein YncE